MSAFLGLALVAWAIWIHAWSFHELRAAGASRLFALRYVFRSPIVYVGLFLVVEAVAPPVGATIFVIGFVAATVVTVWMIVWVLVKVPGVVRRLPKNLHDIGDPSSWRGSVP